MIYFFNDEKELQKVVNSKNVINAVHEQELNGLILSQVELDLFYAKKFIEKVTYFGYFYDETFYMHKIKRVEDNHHEETVIIVGRHIFFEDMLKGKLIEDIRPVNRDAKYVLENTVTVNTGWQIEQDGVTKHLNGSFYWNLPMEVIDKVVQEWQIDYEPRINFDGKKITRGYVHVSEKINKDLGKRIVFGSKVLELKYEVDYDGIITKLVVHGKGEEVGDGYGRRIDIANIDFKRNGVISPKGERYLYNAALIEEYGELYGREVFEDIEDMNELANAGYEFYLENSRPKMLFESSIAQIGSVKIGEIVTIIRHEHDLYFKARIHKLSVDLLNPSDAQVELGDYEHFKHSKIERVQAKKEKNREQQTNNRIESLKRQFDTEFDAQVDDFRKEFEQKLIDVNAQIEASEQRMKDRADEIERQTLQNLADFTNAFTEYADNIRTETKQYADILNASVTQSVTTLRSALDNAEGTIATITNDLSSVKTQVGTIGRDYVKSAELNVLSSEIQKRVLKSEYDAFTDTTTRKLNETVSTAEGNSTLIAQATGRIDDLAKWRADKGQAIEETIDSYSRKIWRDDIDNLQIGGRNLSVDTLERNRPSRNTGVSSDNFNYEAYYTTEPIQSGKDYTIHGFVEITDGDFDRVTVYEYPSGNREVAILEEGGYFSTTIRARGQGSDRFLIYNGLSGATRGNGAIFRKVKIEKGNKPTDWTPAPEDAEARITEIKQTADRVALQAQSIADDYVKQSGVVVTGDKVQIGSKIVNGDVLASLITVSPNAIDVITDNLNLKGSLTVTNQIKTMALDAVYADIAKLRTNVLVANVITADMVKFDTALIEKFTSSTAFINSLTAKSAFINNVKAIDIDFNRASATGLNGSNTLLITADRIEQRGNFNRRYHGKSYNYDVTATMRGGYLRFGDNTQQRAINISAFGISTYLDGDGEWAGSPGSSGYIQWWDGTYSPSNANGITMGSYNVVALKSDNNRVVLDAEASVSIESQTSPVYIYPYKRDRPGLNRFNFTTSSTSNATQVHGYIMYGAGDENYPYKAGLRFYKNERRVAVVGENFETGGDTTLEAGFVEVNNVKRRSDGRFAYWNGSSTGTIDDVSSNTSGQLLATSMVTIKGDRDMFLGTRGGGILRVTDEKGYNSGNGITYRDIHFQNWKANSHEDSKYEIQNWNANILDVYRNELKLKKFKLKSEKDLENQFFHRGIVIRKDSTKDEFPSEWRSGDGFNGNEVMWWAVKGVQELAYENDELKSEIKELKSQINKIMEMIA